MAVNDRSRVFDAMRSCIWLLSGSKPMTTSEGLGALASYAGIDAYPDCYGTGDVMSLVESRSAEIFGAEDAVFFPTGAMAQQVALRYWGEVEGDLTSSTQPVRHQAQREQHASLAPCGPRLNRPAPDPRIPEPRPRHATAEEIAEPGDTVGALVVEPPLRDAGSALPTWDDFVALVEAARAAGARVHFDGARLWETSTHFGRPLSEIAGLADSVSISLDESLGSGSGAVLVGDADLARYAKSWRDHSVGDLCQQWPAAVGVLLGMESELPRMPSYVEHARMAASVLSDLPGVQVLPSLPDSNQFEIWLPYSAGELNQAALDLAEEELVWFVGGWKDTSTPGMAMAEITIVSSALALSEAGVRSIAEHFMARLP